VNLSNVQKNTGRPKFFKAFPHFFQLAESIVDIADSFGEDQEEYSTRVWSSPASSSSIIAEIFCQSPPPKPAPIFG